MICSKYTYKASWLFLLYLYKSLMQVIKIMEVDRKKSWKIYKEWNLINVN